MGDNRRIDLLPNMQNMQEGAVPELPLPAGACVSDVDPVLGPHGHIGLRARPSAGVPQGADTSSLTPEVHAEHERQTAPNGCDAAVASERDLNAEDMFDVWAMD